MVPLQACGIGPSSESPAAAGCGSPAGAGSGSPARLVECDLALCFLAGTVSVSPCWLVQWDAVLGLLQEQVHGFLAGLAEWDPSLGLLRELVQDLPAMLVEWDQLKGLLQKTGCWNWSQVWASCRSLMTVSLYGWWGITESWHLCGTRLEFPCKVDGIGPSSVSPAGAG